MTKVFKIVVLGEIDSGKSTLIGRMLFDSNSVPQDRKEILLSDEELDFSKLLDSLEEEREGKLTIETTQTFLDYKNNLYILIDVPGHKRFFLNMLSGVTSAEQAILLVDIEKEVGEQIRKYLLILKFLNMENFIIAVNKMDKVSFEEKIFQQIKKKVLNILQELELENIEVIPISAKRGENIFEKSSKMNWYKGLSILASLRQRKIVSENLALRFGVQDSYQIGKQKVVVGIVLAGEIKSNDIVKVAPQGRVLKVKEIVVFGEKKKSAFIGDCIGIVLKPALEIKRGNVIYKGKSPDLIQRFNATILILRDLTVGSKLLVKYLHHEVKGRLVTVNEVIELTEKSVVKSSSDVIKEGKIVKAEIETEGILIMEKYSRIRELGRFTLEKENKVMAIGIRD